MTSLASEVKALRAVFSSKLHEMCRSLQDKFRRNLLRNHLIAMLLLSAPSAVYIWWYTSQGLNLFQREPWRLVDFLVVLAYVVFFLKILESPGTVPANNWSKSRSDIIDFSQKASVALKQAFHGRYPLNARNLLAALVEVLYLEVKLSRRVRSSSACNDERRTDGSVRLGCPASAGLLATLSLWVDGWRNLADKQCLLNSQKSKVGLNRLSHD